MATRRNTQNMAIPLCLPNNCQWNAATGEYIKTGERRSSLYVVEEALQKLRTVRGNKFLIEIVARLVENTLCDPESTFRTNFNITTVALLILSMNAMQLFISNILLFLSYHSDFWA